MSSSSLALSVTYIFGLASMAKHRSAVTHSGAFLTMDGEVYYRPIIPAAAFSRYEKILENDAVCVYRDWVWSRNPIKMMKKPHLRTLQGRACC